MGVLRQQLEDQGLRPTWYPSTIHRLLRLKLSRQEEQERCDPTEQTATALEHLGLVLVDESSMVDSRLLEITLQCAHTYGTRLVFVGDPAQLPPVSEESSPVFAMKRSKPTTFKRWCAMAARCCVWPLDCAKGSCPAVNRRCCRLWMTTAAGWRW